MFPFSTRLCPLQISREFAISAENTESRDLLKKDMEALFRENYPQALANIRVINMGPPSPYPVILRINGEDTETLKQIAEKAAGILRSDFNLKNINFDWKGAGKSHIPENGCRPNGLSRNR